MIQTATTAFTDDTSPGRLGPLVVRSRRRELNVGRARLTVMALGRHRAFLAFGGLFFLMGSLFAAAPWALFARDTRIARDGTATTATVTRHEAIQDADGATEHRIHYSFALADGTFFDSRESVSRDGFKSLRVGDPIRIVYDPERPSDGYPLGNGQDIDGGLQSVWGAAMFSAFGALFASVGGLFLWGLLVRLPGAWHRLLSDGYEALGNVTQVEVGEENASQARIHYSYPDRFGTHREGKTEWVPRALVHGWQAGDPGIVRYGRRDANESAWLGRGDLRFFR